MVRIITLKQQKFSQSDPVLNRLFKKNEVRSSPDPAKIGFSPDPVQVHPGPCSSLVLAESVCSMKPNAWEALVENLVKRDC